MGCLKSNILIEFYKSLESIKSSSIENIFAKLPWGNKDKLFENNLPVFTHEILLFLNKTIQYEILTQGRRISPNWYISNLLFSKYAEGYTKTFKSLFNFTTKQLDSLNKSKLFKNSRTDKWANLYVCCYLDRILEHSQKLNLIVPSFESTYNVF